MHIATVEAIEGDLIPAVTRPRRPGKKARAYHDGMVTVSGPPRTLGGALMKIGNDVRWYACGPGWGLVNSGFPKTNPAPLLCRARSIRLSVRRSRWSQFKRLETITRSNLRAPKATFSSMRKPAMLHNVLPSIEFLTDASLSSEHPLAPLMPQSLALDLFDRLELLASFGWTRTRIPKVPSRRT